MEFLSIVEIWKYFKWLPKYTLRRIFNKERLADLVLIDVQARYEAVKVDLGDISSFEIYFQVINMTPFDLELDRAEIEFRCAGTSLKSQFIRKTLFKAGENSSLYVSDDIDIAKANQIARLCENNRSSVSMHAEFNCSLHDFTKATNRLEGVNVHFNNAEWRRSVQENKV